MEERTRYTDELLDTLFAGTEEAERMNNALFWTISDRVWQKFKRLTADLVPDFPTNISPITPIPQPENGRRLKQNMSSTNTSSDFWTFRDQFDLFDFGSRIIIDNAVFDKARMYVTPNRYYYLDIFLPLGLRAVKRTLTSDLCWRMRSMVGSDVVIYNDASSTGYNTGIADIVNIWAGSFTCNPDKYTEYSGGCYRLLPKHFVRFQLSLQNVDGAESLEWVLTEEGTFELTAPVKLGVQKPDTTCMITADNIEQFAVISKPSETNHDIDIDTAKTGRMVHIDKDFVEQYKALTGATSVSLLVTLQGTSPGSGGGDSATRKWKLAYSYFKSVVIINPTSLPYGICANGVCYAPDEDATPNSVREYKALFDSTSKFVKWDSEGEELIEGTYTE